MGRDDRRSCALKGHSSGITQAFFLLDGNRLLTSSTDGTVARWDVSTGQELPLGFTKASSENRDAFEPPITGWTCRPMAGGY